MSLPPDLSALRYGLGDCSLTAQPLRFLVASTEGGVCALLFDYPGQDDALLEDLARRFPTRRLLREPSTELLKQVRALLEGSRSTLDLPFTPQGTDFQKRIWRALQAIPAGSTVTYTQLAHSLGLPATAVRAVAGACAANPLAVAIPCHRVVRADGSLAGYRWGLARKCALLQREAEQTMALNAFRLTP